MAELEGADEAGNTELALTGQWLRVDHQPRLALGRQESRCHFRR
jgi:hypothetical protein